jgi:hypothetical protein
MATHSALKPRFHCRRLGRRYLDRRKEKDFDFVIGECIRNPGMPGPFSA